MPAAAEDEIVWEYSTGLSLPYDAERLANGNTLITDCTSNRVIEVTPAGSIAWEYSGEISYPQEAERLSNGNTLIVDGDPSRVIEVTSDGTIVWEYGGLSMASDAERLSNGNTLIVDCGNNRVIEVTPAGSIAWEYSTGLNIPGDVERLADGNTLITDCLNFRVIEVTPAGSIVWEYSAAAIGLPIDAERLLNGNTLIAVGVSSGNNCVIEVDSAGTVVWEYSTGLAAMMDFWDAERLSNGNTLIADTYNYRVIEVGTPEAPDLVVEKSVTFNEDGTFTVNYTVSNIGDGPAGESTTCKFVNGTLMESQTCPALGPGKSHSGTFEPEPCPCGAILNVTVCADNDNVVKESDETNNCEVNIVECPDPWHEINEKLDSLKGNVSAATMPSIIQRRLVDKLEYAKALKENAKEECKAGNFDGATKKLGVAKSQVESFASMVRITRRISSADKASFLADSTEIKGKIQALIEYVETEHKC